MAPSTANDFGAKHSLSRIININSLVRRTLNHSSQKMKSPIPSKNSSSISIIPKPKPFPFLALPRELREIIYDYIRHSDLNNPIANEIIYSDEWGFDFLTNAPAYNDPMPLTLPADSGFLCYHGTKPPLNLQLTCQQMHAELWDHVFEVGALNPHHDEVRFDPTYQKLARSSRLPYVQKILVKIQLLTLKLRKGHRGQGPAYYEDIGLEECVSRVQVLAGFLVRALRNRAKGLRLVLIDWEDDFMGDEDKRMWELKLSVLLQFGTLEKVGIQLNRLIVVEKERSGMQRALESALLGLSGR